MAGRIKPITAVAVVFFRGPRHRAAVHGELGDAVRADPRQGRRRCSASSCCCRPDRSRSATPCSLRIGAYTAAFWGKYMRWRRHPALSGARRHLVHHLRRLIVGLFVVRYREIFFGMLNLAFSMVLWSLLEKMFHYTNGADGIRVARPGLAGIHVHAAEASSTSFSMSASCSRSRRSSGAALSRQPARPHAAGHEVERDAAGISRNLGPARAARSAT